SLSAAFYGRLMLLRHLTLARYESRQFNNCRFVWKLRRRRFLAGMGWPWPLIPSAIIAIVAAREFLETFVFSSAMENAYDREMEREIARERARLGISDSYDTAYDYEKPKRGEKAKRGEPLVRLSDDGELVPVDDDEEAESERRAGYGTRGD
ncbi:MAG: hypothetical protein ACYDBJ_26040, partial [Aggregatilineales bacterium]